MKKIIALGACLALAGSVLAATPKAGPVGTVDHHHHHHGHRHWCPPPPPPPHHHCHGWGWCPPPPPPPRVVYVYR